MSNENKNVSNYIKTWTMVQSEKTDSKKENTGCLSQIYLNFYEVYISAA